MSTAAIVFAVNVLSSLFKKFIYPRFGKLGVQVSVFALAFIGALYVTWLHNIPGIAALVGAAVGIFSLAVTFYEVILSRLPIFKVPSASNPLD